jgi:6-phosphogluconate dehydrogenase (decarboxylating)
MGVGNMGGAMAQRLCTLGWQPRVHDIDAARVQALLSFGAAAGEDGFTGPLGVYAASLFADAVAASL